MRLLILGGTSFLGRHVAEEALRRGTEVTLFNRGRTAPSLFPGVERLRGDREGDLSALDGRTWDAVVDTCGFVPRAVRASAERLARSVGHYTFVSSVSVYPDFPRPGCDESWPAAPPDYESAEVAGENYGPLKHACEIEVERAFPDGALIVRPGLIVGPHDTVPRLPYWLRRAARGGRVVAPGEPSRPVQLVDARDIAAWVLDLAARGGTGLFNITGFPGALTMGEVLETCREVTASDARYVWVDDARLAAAGVQPWDGLPYWLPVPGPAIMHVSVERARRAGFVTRPFADTARDTWAWLSTLPPEDPPHRRVLGKLSIVTGIAPTDEARLLASLSAPDPVPAPRGD